MSNSFDNEVIVDAESVVIEDVEENNKTAKQSKKFDLPTYILPIWFEIVGKLIGVLVIAFFAGFPFLSNYLHWEPIKIIAGGASVAFYNTDTHVYTSAAIGVYYQLMAVLAFFIFIIVKIACVFVKSLEDYLIGFIGFLLFIVGSVIFAQFRLLFIIGLVIMTIYIMLMFPTAIALDRRFHLNDTGMDKLINDKLMQEEYERRF